MDWWLFKDAALLLSGLDPDYCKDLELDPGHFHTGLERAFGLYQIFQRTKWEEKYGVSKEIPPLVFIREALSKNIAIPDGLVAFAKTQDGKSIQEEQIKSNADAALEKAVEAYTTSALIALRAAIRKFWIDYDETRPPKKNDIVRWLQGNYDLSENLAQAIDAIIRPDAKRKGGNVKRRNSNGGNH